MKLSYLEIKMNLIVFRNKNKLGDNFDVGKPFFEIIQQKSQNTIPLFISDTKGKVRKVCSVPDDFEEPKQSINRGLKRTKRKERKNKAIKEFINQ